MNEKISVIVPVYKVERYLDSCVRSIVNQTYTDLEIILVDDGSPDNCGAICDAWAEKDSRIKVIHKENGGLPDARNAGLRIATGEWFVFIDSDDVVSVYLIESLVRMPLEKDHIAVAAFTKFKDTPPDDKNGQEYQFIEGNDWLRVRSSFFCWAVLYNREIIDRAKLMFDTNLTILEDEGWNAVYLLFVRGICYVTEPMYYYRENPTSLTGGSVDHLKWNHAWQKVQHSVMKWFVANDPEERYKKECRAFYRHCQNKMISTSVDGRISYRDYRAGNETVSEEVDGLLLRLFHAEHLFHKYLPHLYYSLYVMLMKLRNLLVDLRNR